MADKRIKVTFTVDEATVSRLNDAARRLAISKSEVVREAIQDYHLRIGKLSEAERRRMLGDFDRLVPRIPERPAEQVESELHEIREARRRSDHRKPGRKRP